MNSTSSFAFSAAHRPVAAGRCMMAAGIIGLLAMASLIAAVTTRWATQGPSDGHVDKGVWDLLLRLHDAGGMAQALLMIPGVYALHDVSRQAGSAMSRAMIPLGVAANVLLAASLALIFITHASDMLYMFPQGLVGVWLIVTNRRMPMTFSKGLRVAGIVAGIGLLLIALANAGIGMAHGPSMFTLIGPMPETVDVVAEKSALNIYSHVVMDIGMLLGVFTYPIWAILAGRRLSRR
jgi:hypothetical protein